MLTWQEIGYYLRLLRRWWWLLLVAIILPMGVAFLRTNSMPDYYVARATLMVGDHFMQATPDIRQVRISNELARFYQEITTRRIILEPVSAQLLSQTGRPMSWWQIRKVLDTEISDHANLLEIAVTDTDPQRARIIVDAIANQLITYSPSSPDKIAEERAVLDEEIQVAREARDSIAVRIEELQQQELSLDSAYDIRSLQEQIASLQTTYDEASNRYLDLLEMRRDTTANQLIVFEPAEIPATPLPSRQPIIIVMAGFGGLLVAVFAVLLLDRLDERWRSGAELQDRTGITCLGSVPGSQPMLLSVAAQATRRERMIRDVYTRILLNVLERNGRTFLITSPKPNRGRSAFTFDLAELFARSGHRVIVVDADTLVDDDGAGSSLSQLVKPDGPTEQLVALQNDDVQVAVSVQPTPLDQVALLGRYAQSDERQLVPRMPWNRLLASLLDHADIVLFDGPSALPGADAALLAPLVEGVVLALDPARDTRSDIIESKQRVLRHAQACLIGAVIVSGKATAGELRKAGLSRKNVSSNILTGKAGNIEAHSQ